jgi:hypothetical protein
VGHTDIPFRVLERSLRLTLQRHRPSAAACAEGASTSWKLSADQDLLPLTVKPQICLSEAPMIVLLVRFLHCIQAGGGENIPGGGENAFAFTLCVKRRFRFCEQPI